MQLAQASSNFFRVPLPTLIGLRKGTLLLISPHWSVGLWFKQTNKQSIQFSGVPRGGQGREGVVGTSVVLVDGLRRLRKLLFSCNTYCMYNSHRHTQIYNSLIKNPQISWCDAVLQFPSRQVYCMLLSPFLPSILVSLICSFLLPEIAPYIYHM